MKFRTNLKIKSGIIDPVPLVNVVFVLVVFFALSARFSGNKGIVFNLPQIEESDIYSKSAAVISVQNGCYFVDDKILSGEDMLIAELIKMPKKAVAIKAGNDVSHGEIVRLLSILKQCGIEDIALAVNE